MKEITDPKIPKGFTVLGVQDIKGKVYVSYANAAGEPGGYIDIFTESGTFVKTFAKGKPLNQPWGFAVAPKNFGPLSNTLLISNNTNTGTPARSMASILRPARLWARSRTPRASRLPSISFGRSSSVVGLRTTGRRISSTLRRDRTMG